MSIANRRMPRKRLQQFLTVLDSSTQQIIGRMADISETGMMLISTAPLNQTDTLTIDILPPADQNIGILTIDAEVMWVRQNQQHYGAGLQFHNVSSDKLSHIKNLINLADL